MNFKPRDSFRCLPLGGMVIILSFVFLTLTGCYEQVQTKKVPEAVPVRIAAVQKEDVRLYGYFTGNTQVEPIKIVPRIRGYIEEICFSPGDIVEKGDQLFKIEQFDYKNMVEQQQANLNIAKANEAKAKADYDREVTLSKKGEGFTTQADIDRTKALHDNTVAQIELAQAELAEAQKQLERTIIKAPVRGKISRNLIELGNLVDGTGPNPPELASLIAMDPMYVYFQVTDSEFIKLQRDILKKIKEKMGKKYGDSEALDNKTVLEYARENHIENVIQFDVQLLGDKPNESSNQYPYQGIIDYNDNYIDRTTGTNTIRGRIKNANYLVYPGALCKIRIAGDMYSGALLVQEKAIGHDLNEQYLWVLDDQKMPQKRKVTLGHLLEDGRRIILSGLQAGDSYVVDGVQKVRAGVSVKDITNESPAKESSQASAKETDQEKTKESAQEPAKDPAPAPEKK